MSHLQAYINAAAAQEKNPKRNISAPLPTVTRKPASYSTMPPIASSNPPSKPASTTPSTSSLRRDDSPSSTTRPSGPTPSTEFRQAAAKTALATHPPTSPMASTPKQPKHEQPTISEAQISKALSHALALLQNASTYHSKRPFSALLLAPDNQSILLSHFSISHIRHAESELARLASDQFSSSYLSQCTLVSTWEPCAMCAGTIYWSGIGRVLYAASEDRLQDLTGAGNEENMTMSLPCRTVLKAGQRPIEVVGPVSEWEEKVIEECSKWWIEHGGTGVSKANTNGVNGVNGHLGHAKGETASVVTTWTGEESVLSSIGEDGEYKADLDIDWMR